MQSDVDVLRARAHKVIQELKKLKNTKKELESGLRELTARKVDVERKRSAELQLGKEIREEVRNWLNDVEQMEEEVQDNEGLIRSLCAPGNIARIVSETASSNVVLAGNAAVYGVGGIGVTSFNLDRSIITTSIGEIKTTNHHHYNDKGTQ